MKTILLLIIALIYIKVTAQNLVTNGNFEYYNSLNGFIDTSVVVFPCVQNW